MKFKTVLMLLVLTLLWNSCKVVESNLTHDDFVRFERKITHLDNKTYKIDVTIKGKDTFRGYLVFMDRFSGFVKLQLDKDSRYQPFVSDSSKIRFVLDKNSLTKDDEYQFSYYIKTHEDSTINVNGIVRYLIANQPVPELENNILLKPTAKSQGNVVK